MGWSQQVLPTHAPGCESRPPRTKRVLRSLLARARVLALLPMAGLSLAGCNTAAGFGKDIEALGENISEGSRDARR